MIDHKKMKQILYTRIFAVVLMSTAVIFSRELPLKRTTERLDPDTRFYVPRPNPDAPEQIKDLKADRKLKDARLIQELIEVPQAVWFTGRSPKEVKLYVEEVIESAAAQSAMPILVPYNIPLRDCGHYSAGGADDIREYKAWIREFAAGIGDYPAIIILEPDSLGIIPHHVDINGNLDWCQPKNAYKLTAARDRFMLLNDAVDVLKGLPNVRVYLDGTQSRWLSPGDAAERLVKAGVKKADGFFLNISNYQYTEHLIRYGTWVSKCIWYASEVESTGYGRYADCGSQYATAKFDVYSTWHLVDEWYAKNVDQQRSAPYPGNDELTHFVIDTSRNGRGRWIPPIGTYEDAQDWCNAPRRGVGSRPTANTGNPIVDALLWIKIPGESDGECTRSMGPAGRTVDPEWGVIDPISGEWFPEMALELARRANPPLE